MELTAFNVGRVLRRIGFGAILISIVTVFVIESI